MNEPSPKEVVRRIAGAWNTGDPSFVRRYYDQSFRFRSSTGETTDRDGFREVVEGVFEAFADLLVETDYLVAEGDRVVAKVTVSGVHDGEFRGIPPTGERVSFDSVFLYRIEDGVVVEEEHRTDNLGLLEQIDAVEPPA